MQAPKEEQYGFNVVANGRNWNYIKLLTGHAKRWTGHHLTGINFKFKDNEVVVVIKKDSPKGPQVAFVWGPDLDGALYNLAYEIKSKSLRWRTDKYRTTRSDAN